AKLAHQLGLLLDQDEPSLVDDADPIGDLLGFLYIMCGQDDRDARLAQAANELPHVLAQLDIDARGRFIEAEDFRLVGERLGDHHAAFHAARERHDLAVLLVPEGQVLQDRFDKGRVGLFSEQAPAEVHRVPDGFEGFDMEFLRDQPDQGTRRLIIGENVVALHQNLAAGGIDQAANDGNQRRLAGPVWAKKRQDLTIIDVEIDAMESGQARVVGFCDLLYGNRVLHGYRLTSLTGKAKMPAIGHRNAE